MTLYYYVINAILKQSLSKQTVAHSPQYSLYCTCKLKCHGSQQKISGSVYDCKALDKITWKECKRKILCRLGLSALSASDQKIALYK